MNYQKEQFQPRKAGAGETRYAAILTHQGFEDCSCRYSFVPADCVTIKVFINSVYFCLFGKVLQMLKCDRDSRFDKISIVRISPTAMN